MTNWDSQNHDNIDCYNFYLNLDDKGLFYVCKKNGVDIEKIYYIESTEDVRGKYFVSLK